MLDKEKILKAERDEDQLTYKSKSIRITDFSLEAIKESPALGNREPWEL